MKQQFNSACCAAGLVLLTSLSGCARIDAVGTNLMSSHVAAVAVVGDQILSGYLQLYPDRTGSVRLAVDRPDEKGFATSCMGRLRFAGSTTGTIDLRCNTGVATELTFSKLGDISGFAYGQYGTSMISFVFGLDYDQAKSYLRAPPSKQLVLRPEDGALVLQ